MLTKNFIISCFAELSEALRRIEDFLKGDSAKVKVLEHQINRLEEQNHDLMNRFMSRSYEELRIYEPSTNDLPGDMVDPLEGVEPGEVIDGLDETE